MATMARATAFAMALLLTGAAAAEDKPAPLDSHLSAAVDLIDAMNAKTNLVVLIDAMDSSMLAQVKQAHPGASDKALAAFQAAFKKEMTAATDDLLKLEAAVYAEHFSESDLHTIAAFYRSGAGKHLIDEQPAIIKEVTPLALKWGMDTGKKAADRAMEKLQKEGITL